MWTTLAKGLKNTFTSKSPKELFDEWQTGFSMSDSMMKQNERNLIDDLKDRIEEIQPIAPRMVLHLPLDVDHLRRQRAEAVKTGERGHD